MEHLGSYFLRRIFLGLRGWRLRHLQHGHGGEWPRRRGRQDRRPPRQGGSRATEDGEQTHLMTLQSWEETL